MIDYLTFLLTMFFDWVYFTTELYMNKEAI